MKSTKYIPLHLLIGLIIGILIAYKVTFPLIQLILFVTLLISILIYLFFRYKREVLKDLYFSIVTILLFSGIGALAMYVATDINHSKHYTQYLKEDNNTTILIIEEELKNNAYFHNYTAKVIEINSKITTGHVRLSRRVDVTSKPLQTGDKFVVITSFQRIPSPQNPYQFNFKKYLEKQQIYHQITLTTEKIFFLKSKHSTLNYWAYQIRKRIVYALESSGLMNDDLAITEALLLGQRQQISEELMKTYQNAGAIHILALSGLHIGVIVWILNFLLKPLFRIRYGKTIKLIVIITFLWAYAVIAGLSPSIIRAVTMFTALVFAFLNNQSQTSATTIRVLIMSAFFLLLINPYYLWDVGFQLSYTAVFFIIWLLPLLKSVWQPKYIIVKYFWNIFIVSIAAQIGVLPVSIFYFNQFPGLFFISNIAIIPILGILLGTGFLIVITALLYKAPEFLVYLYKQGLSFMNSVVNWVSRQEAFLFEKVYLSFLSLFLVYLFIITFSIGFKTKKIKIVQLGALILILFQLTILFEKYHQQKYNEFIVFNKSKTTLITLKNANIIMPLYFTDTINFWQEPILKTYVTTTRSTIIVPERMNKKLFEINTNKLLLIDSLGVYRVTSFKPDYILLVNSPSINLERLLKLYTPKLVIADASNFKTRVETWEKTCKTYNIKFHYTVTDGAFMERFHD